MAMLQLVQQASAELGLAVPSSVAGNQTQDVVQMLALLNAAGYELARQYPWQALNTEYRFTTQYSTQTGATTDGSAQIIVGNRDAVEVLELLLEQAALLVPAFTLVGAIATLRKMQNVRALELVE